MHDPLCWLFVAVVCAILIATRPRTRAETRAETRDEETVTILRESASLTIKE